MLKKLASNLGVLGFSKYLKFSYIIGTNAVFFSAVNILAPVAGIAFGLKYLILASLIIGAFKFALFGSVIYTISLYHVPQFFASAYWRFNSSLFKITVPLVAALIFFVHPQGSFVYPVLWLVPIFAIFFKNSFSKALGATFTAHAVGSVIHLLAVGGVYNWVSIMPIAIIERIMFAIGIFCMLKLVENVKFINVKKYLYQEA